MFNSPSPSKKTTHSIQLGCLLALLGYHHAAFAKSNQFGFFAGISGSLDSSRLNDSTSQDYYEGTAPSTYPISIRGFDAGVQAGLEWLHGSKPSGWKHGLAVEYSYDNSTASSLYTDMQAPLFSSYRISTVRAYSVLPIAEKNGKRFFLHIGRVTAKLHHNLDTEGNAINPAYTKNLNGWIGGFGLGHSLSTHWLWQAEWDTSWYGEINTVDDLGINYTEKLRQNIWRLSLSWHMRTLSTTTTSDSTLPAGAFISLGAGQDNLRNQYHFQNEGSGVPWDGEIDYALSGPAAQLALGYQWVGRHMTIGLVLSASKMNSTMRYERTETEFTYKHSSTISATLQPGWQFSPGQSIFIEAGVGRIDVRKEGATGGNESPNFNRKEDALIWGAGYRSTINPSNTVVLHVQYVQTRPFEQTDGASSYKNKFNGPLFLISWEHYASQG